MSPPITPRSRILLGLLGTLSMLSLTYLYIHDCHYVDLWNRPGWVLSSHNGENNGSEMYGGVPTDVADPTEGDLYLLGVGKAGITGPVVEINLMGYADADQVGSGLRQRLYSRAFIVGDLKHSEDAAVTRFIYLVLDTQSGDTAIRHGILEGLRAMGPEYKMYGQSNVAVTGTHSHSGPGAWLNYLLPQITSKGFDKQSYQAIVDGALLSIKRAHQSLAPGYLGLGSIDIPDANINRSPYAYLANPEEERRKYKHDVDKELTLLRFQRAEDGKNIGVLTWFPVHGTSMLGNNTLISGDNKGVAAYLFEQSMKRDDSAAENFVAGFSQSNVGDTSPNVLGAFCEDGSGERCNFEDSTCGGKTQPCHGRGPFFWEKDQGASSCYEIGRRQYAGAKAIYDSMKDGIDYLPLRDPSVMTLHTFKDFSNYTFPHRNGTIVTTCPAALGYSFAAGTTDGPGAFDFKQNGSDTPNANPVWAVASGFLHEPSEEQRRCHGHKPILLDVGEVKRPYAWTPNIVDIQLLRVGPLIIIVSPGEATTMAGRRWKEALANDVNDPGLDGFKVVLGGPANSYTHYIATEEEYAVQRYEGASTLYGPNTLEAYINVTRELLPFLIVQFEDDIPRGPSPPVNTNRSLSFITGVVYDRAPLFKQFGDVVEDVQGSYQPGDTVHVRFVGANPRNNLKLESTYAAVEILSSSSGVWETVRDDADWALVFKWKRTNSVLGTSEVEIVWEIERGVEEGMYRIRYFGHHKTPLSGEINPFEGTSAGFSVG
ncbi:MAG: hypothetical protein M1836_002662 [Candelina mexicana]|nr:MAG: hypothetical protein M1836_002662 [Candelina mexicana]